MVVRQRCIFRFTLILLYVKTKIQSAKIRSLQRMFKEINIISADCLIVYKQFSQANK